MQESLWNKNSELPRFKQLSGDFKTDVLIVGGGLCGLLCAYFLEQAGVSYALLEGGRIAGGVTRNTTAKITAQHGLIYSQILSRRGKSAARQYLKANLSAVENYARLCADIDCGFERAASFVYSRNGAEQLRAEKRAIEMIGGSAELTTETELPFRIDGALRMDNQARFDPIRFATAISAKLNIYECSYVNKISGGTAFTSHGSVSADKIIIATHFPFINRYGMYFLKLYQSRSYAAALSGAPRLEGMYLDQEEGGVSLRSHGEYLIVGAGGGRCGKYLSTEAEGWNMTEEFVSRYYPNCRVEYKWAAQDCMSLDGIPYIGRYSAGRPELLVASGFNKWGMTASMVAAELLCDLVLERENESAELFSPQRSMMSRQLLINAGEAAANILTPSVPRCPHMGCALKWNSAEQTWDCPCHGSRFTRDGQLIDNPAMKNAAVRQQKF